MITYSLALLPVIAMFVIWWENRPHPPISAFALGIIASMREHPEEWSYYGTYIPHHAKDETVDLSLTCTLFGQWQVNNHPYVTKREIAAIKEQGIWALRRHEAREMAAERAAHRAPFEAMGHQSNINA